MTDLKRFYDTVKAGLPKPGTTSLLSADGSTLIAERQKFPDRLLEHFESVTN